MVRTLRDDVQCMSLKYANTLYLRDNHNEVKVPPSIYAHLMQDAYVHCVISLRHMITSEPEGSRITQVSLSSTRLATDSDTRVHIGAQQYQLYEQNLPV